MSGFSNQEDYWMPPQNQYNFENNSFDQFNQQFEFANFNGQQTNDYESYPQQDCLSPTPNSYTGDLYTSDDYNQSNYCNCIFI